MKEVVITEYRKGTCILRGNQTEGVEVTFGDCGLKGFVGWGEFKKLLQARSADRDANAAPAACDKQPSSAS